MSWQVRKGNRNSLIINLDLHQHNKNCPHPTDAKLRKLYLSLVGWPPCTCSYGKFGKVFLKEGEISPRWASPINRASSPPYEQLLKIFHSSSKKIDYNLKFKLDGKHLTTTSTVKYLVVPLDDHLLWLKELVNSKTIHLLKLWRWHTIFLFSSHLLYGSQLWWHTCSCLTGIWVNTWQFENMAPFNNVTINKCYN